MAYTPTTWVNGTTAVNATNMNHIETFLSTINSAATDGNISAALGILTALGMSINPTAVTVSGSVSGSATLYQLFSGTVKLVLVSHNNYKSAASQTLALPTAFTGNSYWWTMELQGGKVEALSGGSGGTLQTFSVLTTLNISGGTQNPQTQLNSWSQGGCRNGFDTFRITVTGASSATGLTFMFGV